MCTASLTFIISTFSTHTVFMCSVWISEQTAIISLYNINCQHNACRGASLLFFLVNSTGESIYAFDIIARFFLQSALRVFVIQQQFSVRYRVIFFIFRNVSLGIFFSVPKGGERERERERNVHIFSAHEAFAVIGYYTVSVGRAVQMLTVWLVSVCCAGRAVSSYQPGRAQASSAPLRKPESSLQIPAE